MIVKILASIRVLLSLVVPSTAQPYPSNPVRIIVPFAAGGSPDIVARIIAQQLTTRPACPSSSIIALAPTA